jgi:hypothetical protein
VNAYYATSTSPHWASETDTFHDLGLFDSIEVLDVANDAHVELPRNSSLPFMSMDNTTHSHVTRKDTSFGFHLDLQDQDLERFHVHEGLAALGDKYKNDMARKMERERLHLSQWAGLRRCMHLVQHFEVARGMRFNYVAKFRDDSVVFAPLVLNKRLMMQEPNFLMSLNCMDSRHNGVHDNWFVVGRDKAPCLFYAFLDEYFNHPEKLEAVVPTLRSPELFVGHYARMCELVVTGFSMCNAPVVSMDFVAVPGHSASTEISSESMWIRGGTMKSRKKLLPCMDCADGKERSCWVKSDGAPGVSECPELHRAFDARIDAQQDALDALNITLKMDNAKSKTHDTQHRSQHQHQHRRAIARRRLSHSSSTSRASIGVIQ